VVTYDKLDTVQVETVGFWFSKQLRPRVHVWIFRQV